MGPLLDATSIALEKALDLRMRKHEVHTSNLANSNVPDFKAKKIDFEARMAEALEASTDNQEPQIAVERQVKGAISGVRAEVYDDPFARASGDGNTVNSEQEQVELAKNQIGYQGAIQLINKKFAMARYVLSEGGR
jgi:flagellar basal-body rod protein FlgB